MQKQEIAAYLITESSAPVSVSNVEVFDKNSLFYLRFEATLQDFNVLNRNKRIYKGQAMIPSLNRLLRAINNRTLVSKMQVLFLNESIVRESTPF